jgi:WhiB family transcriptional regulator, redox-sensing transcriptional regulator
MPAPRRLPGWFAGGWEWQRRGACRGRGTGQFFHPDGERGSSRLRRELSAKRVCHGCPVRGECAAHALAVREPYGVWGGFTESERLYLLSLGVDDLVGLGRADLAGLERRLATTTASATGAPRQPAGVT